jgi:CRP-like cAMP-binding protein
MSYRLTVGFMIRVSFMTGQVIISKGSQGSIFYIIKSGLVEVNSDDEKFVNTKLSAGSYFGERALISDQVVIQRQHAQLK